MVKPQVSVTPRKQIVDVADTVTFRCSASAGFPAATLRWRRGDGRQLPQFSTFSTRTGVFKILAASRRDEGEYMCTARNTGGESVMRVQLLVKGRDLQNFFLNLYSIDSLVYSIDSLMYSIDSLVYSIDLLVYSIDSLGYSIDSLVYSID